MLKLKDDIQLEKLFYKAGIHSVMQIINLLKVWLYLILLSTVMLNFGCEHTQEQVNMNKFDQQTNLYGRLLRWREYEEAYHMIRYKEDNEVKLAFNEDAYKDLRVTDYITKSIVFTDDGKNAAITVDISYYYETQNTIKKIRDVQDWWFDEEISNWFLNGNLPDFQK